MTSTISAGGMARDGEFSIAGFDRNGVHDQPQFKYLFPDEQLARTVLPWLFRFIARSGQTYSTEGTEDSVVWVGRGDAFTFGRLAREVIAAAPFQLRHSNLRRCIHLCSRLQAARERLAPGPHWYLVPLGLKPSSGTLLQPLLSRADSDGLPCYLETFREGELASYENFGFRIEGAGRITADGLSFWAMVRQPQYLQRER